MANDTRGKMVAGAARLLGASGYAGTSLGDVIELTGAPRGSIYHHFPGGKEQLVSEALGLADSRATSALDRLEVSSPRDVVDGFLGIWRELLVRSDFAIGCSVAGVTVSADSDRVVEVAGRIFAEWQSDLARRLREAGLEGDADGFAALLVAASEGAVILSRAQRTTEPLDVVSAQLVGYLEVLTGAFTEAAH